jgi:CcmD family protein
MNYLFVGTAVVWLAILGYMVSLLLRQNKMHKKLNDLEQRIRPGS